METLRRRAEKVVQELLDRTPAGATLDTSTFVASQPPELRDEVARILGDLAVVRLAFDASEAAVASGATLGDFRLLREIGRGGMAVVWEAEQLSLGRRVALKVLQPPPGLGGRRLLRFAREAAAGARLNHPHIVTVHAVGEAAGAHYIAQELVPGGRTLADVIDEARAAAEAPADWYRTAAALAVQLAEALAFAHQHGVIHRDVKPGNVLVLPDGTPKIGDFGLAVLDDSPTLTRSGEWAGTPFYMAPEQAAGRGDRLDARSDVFSLGATLYELLTLRRPFDGETAREVMEQIRTEDPPAPHRLRSRLPRDLSVICLKALEKSAHRRYARMADLAADLRRFLAHQPITARAPGPVRQIAQWALRHPVASTAGGVAALAIAVLSVLVVEYRAQRLRAGAEAERAAEQSRRADRARADAERDAQAARREAATAEEVTAFLIDLFRAPMPGSPQGREVRAYQVLEQGVARIRESLAGEDAVRARLLDALGRACGALGLYAEAEPLLAEAARIHAAREGEACARALAARRWQAEAQASLGRLAEAEQLARVLVETSRQAAGPDASVTLDMREVLIAILGRAGSWTAAEEESRALLADRERLAPGDVGARASALRLLGAALITQQRWEEAHEVLEQAVAASEEVAGVDAPETLDALGNLLTAERRLGRLAEAEVMQLDHLERCRRVFGVDHPSTLTALSNLGGLYDELEQQDEAERFYLMALDGLRTRFGERHPESLRLLLNLGEMHRAWIDPRAEPYYRRLLELAPGVLPDDHLYLAIATFGLGDLLLELDRHDEAEPWCLDALARFRRAHRGHPAACDGLEDLVRLYRETGRTAEAAALCREARARFPDADWPPGTLAELEAILASEP